MTTRREFLTVTLAGGAAAALAPGLAAAAPKSMSVVHESSFIKAFDEFFVKKLAPDYEKMTGIKINYEPVSVGSMLTRLTTIVETKSGLDDVTRTPPIGARLPEIVPPASATSCAAFGGSPLAWLKATR